MRIRIGQYSLSIVDLFIGAIATYAIILGIHWLGFFGFVGLLLLFVGLALAVRLAACWFTWPEPMVWMQKRDSFLALTFGLIGLTLLIVS